MKAQIRLLMLMVALIFVANTALAANNVSLEVKDPVPGDWTLEVSGFTPFGTDNNAGSLPDTIDGTINVIFPTGSAGKSFSGHVFVSSSGSKSSSGWSWSSIIWTRSSHSG